MIAEKPGALLVLTGASGAGKTTIVNCFEIAFGSLADVFRFDSTGVPPPEDMIVRFGSGEEWQRAMTAEWMTRIAPVLARGRNVVLEGQMRISFIEQATRACGIASAACWLVDCSDAVRSERLVKERGQPELANQKMMDWAQFLRKEAAIRAIPRLKTDTMPCEEAAARISQHFRHVSGLPK